MITILFPALFAIVGMLVYALTSNPKVAQLALYVFLAGILWTVYGIQQHAAHLLS